MVLLLPVFLLLSCREGTEKGPADTDATALSPSARPEIPGLLRADLETVRHSTDGAGRAWIDLGASAPVPAVAGRPGRWTIVFEADPVGVATGGFVFLQISPFWNWTPPRLEGDGPGYTEVTAVGEGLEIAPRLIDQGLIAVEITGRPLGAGDRIRFDYGAGAFGARADSYAESESTFWIAVDGDGDGVRGLIEVSPMLEVVAGPPAQIVALAPTVVRPGEALSLRVSVLDQIGNAWPAVAGVLTITDGAPGESPIPPLVLAPGDRGQATVQITPGHPGVHRYRVALEGRESDLELRGESNPVVVEDDWPRIRWGDLHGHSALSDGTGTPEDYFRYARDVAALDVVALTDHDHWGMEPLSQDAEAWDRIVAAGRRYDQPGSLVALLGYEWTSWLHGHRHVLYFDDGGEVLSSVDPRYEHPTQLWSALRGRDALTFSHHSAGGPVATNWEIPPDPVLEPLTEVASVHGSSEADDSPGAIYSAVAGNFVRDALDRGYRLGFVGSGDGHDGHPGLAELAAPSGGIAAIMADEVNRDSVLAALRARRTYATNGPRIALRVRLGEWEMGTTLDRASADEARRLIVEVAAPGSLERLDLVRSGSVIESRELNGAREIRLESAVEPLRTGEYLYVRVLQTDGGMAWSSPFFSGD